MIMKLFGICFIFFVCALTGFAKTPVSIRISPLYRKLQSIIIKKVEFEDAKPLAVFKFLRIRSKELDPTGKGVNFVFKDLREHKTLVTVKLNNIPLSEVIKYVCLTGNLNYKIDAYAVVIMPKSLPKKKTKQSK